MLTVLYMGILWYSKLKILKVSILMFYYIKIFKSILKTIAVSTDKLLRNSQIKTYERAIYIIKNYYHRLLCIILQNLSVFIPKHMQNIPTGISMRFREVQRKTVSSIIFTF